ncbi:MAG: metallophosphoesterase [Prolixibacteraceae bacterium]|nr:metallophosphoesterase [Prolixibacteraceae bacterium]
MKTFLPFIILLVVLGIFTGAIIYLSRRMQFYFSTSHTGGWYGLFSFLAIFMIAGLFALSNTTNAFFSVIYKAAAITMGFMLYLLMVMLLTDLVNLVFKISPRLLGITALVLTSLLVAGGIINSYIIRTTIQDITVNGLKNEVKAIHLSDIHVGHFRGKTWVKRIVEKTIAEKPDVVFITGDFFDGTINLKQEVLESFKEIKVPVYFVEGNHDGYTGVETIKKYLRKAGVIVLENEVTHWNGLQIVGLNHLSPNAESFNMHAAHPLTIAEVFPRLKIDSEKPAILLHHSPGGIDIANKYGIDLYLSGHTHGGQQFPITLINELLFKYNRGLDAYRDTKILVSEGLGTFGPPLRIGTKSELISITLKPDQD